MLRLAIAAFAALLSVSAFAQSAKLDRIELVSTGVYQIQTGAATAATGSTPTGTVTPVTTVKNIQSTTTVAAKVGLEFGLQYKLVGSPADAAVVLDMVNIYPPAGLTEPGKAPVRESRYSLTKKIGETNYLGYGIENDWEAVPGTWTFQIWQDGKKLLEQSFTVTK